MFTEHGVIEGAQIVLWVVASLAGVSAAARHRKPRDRLFAWWLSLVAALAALRELDAHTFLNPETLGIWGVRFRIDWWLALESPVWPRVAWLAVAFVLGSSLVAPVLRVSPRFGTLLRARDSTAVALALGAAALAAGYSMDDLLGRGQFVPARYTEALEEILELAGALLICAGVGGLLHRSLGTREGLAAAARSGVKGRSAAAH